MTVYENRPAVSDTLMISGYFRLKDFWSALTHIAGFLAAIVAMPFLMLKGYLAQNETVSMVSYMIYMLSMILLYGASSAYHSFNISEKANLLLKKIDHIVFKLFYVTCPKWVSSVIYTAMGWVCIFALPQLLRSLSAGAFIWLLAGGILYSIGAVIYAIRPKFLANPRFGSHEVFHCFVLAGTFCHFIVVCGFLTMIG